MIQILNRRIRQSLQAIGTASLLFAGPTGAGLPASDRDVDGLKGAVNTVAEGGGPTRVITSYYDQAGNLIKFELSYGGVGGTRTERLQTVFQRDAEGRKRIARSFGADGMPLDEIHYAYDSRGNLGEQGTYRDGKLLFKFIHAYDSQGKRIKTRTYLRDELLKSKSIYTYDNKGRIATISSYKECTSEASKLGSETAGTNDEKDHLTEAVILSDAVCTLEDKAVNKYDQHDRLIESLLFWPDGALKARRHFVYNERGDEEEVAWYAADGSLERKDRSIYIYDTVGNWIQRSTTSLVRDGQPVQEPPAIVRRTITYYEPESGVPAPNPEP